MTMDTMEMTENTCKTSYPKFSERLNLAMGLRGYNNRRLAEDIFVSPSALSSYRSGHRQPNFDVLRSLAVVLNVSTDFLLGLTDYIP